MRVAASVPCDFAQVREGLLFISSGGISQISREAFPSPLNIFLAMSFVTESEDYKSESAHKLSVEAIRKSDQRVVGSVEIEFGFGTVGEETRPGFISLPIPLGGIVLPTPGDYDLVTTLDEADPLTLPIVATHQIIETGQAPETGEVD